jgi:hypothetical protein
MKANLNPLSDAALQLWPEFILSVPSQLEAGKQTYGDQSFQMQTAELSGEVEEELLDVTGWAFVLCVRMKSIRNRIEKESQQCQVQSTK